MLPGWPGECGWTVWRSLAYDPYAVWLEVSRFSIGLGAFAVVVAYPWRAARMEEDPRQHVFRRLFLALIAGGALFAVLGLAQEALGSGDILWISGEPAISGRASGPFINPNHFAAWLEMVIPAGLAYLVAVAGRVRRQLTHAAEAGRGMGVRSKRAWVAALIANQRRLWAPLVAAAGLATMGVAHRASGSRGGTAALLAGLGVVGAGVAMRGTSRSQRARRWLPAAIALGLFLTSAVSLRLWAAAGSEENGATVGEVDVGLGDRLAASVLGKAIVQDHPLFGTGLGSWLHAFRPYQAPPVEGGIWDHAHNDYLELAAESGIVGAVLVLFFVIAVVRAARRSRDSTGGGTVPRKRRRHRGVGQPPGFELPEWREALEARALLRWGLAGGVAAILVHSFVDYSLRQPANLLALMVVLALLVLSGRRQRAGGALSLCLLLVLFTLAAAPQVVNRVLLFAGAVPLSAQDCVDRADTLLAEEGAAARGHALALVRRALDRSPADREAHEALATALGAGPEGEEALRRALALHPWAVEVRDELGLRLWARGDRDAGSAELERSTFLFPYLTSHAYLSPDADLQPSDTGQVVRALVEGDTMKVRLARLEPGMVAAIERGLAGALDKVQAGEARAAILDDLVTLFEAGGRWGEAATVLRAEAERSAGRGDNLPRAARDYLKARDYAAAEQTMLAALLRTPEQGDLYRDLAVDIYAARGDFSTAEGVLKAGERNAVDMLPIYDGLTEVLARRESTHAEDFAGSAAPPRW